MNNEIKYLVFQLFQNINPFDELQAPPSVNDTSITNNQSLQPELQNMGYDNHINQVINLNSFCINKVFYKCIAFSLLLLFV